MSKIGLALSGGGFRATLFHLGVVRYLRDAGLLRDVTDIASVSGGSILAAHLTLNWDRYNGDEDSFAAAADEIVKFVQFDLRNHIARRMPLQWPLKRLAKLLFFEGRSLTSNALLERYYSKFLFGDRCLYELPVQPMLHILATNVSSGAMTAFNRNGVYIQQRGNGERRSFKHVPGQMASIPRVVGASSAFPGFFPPVEVTAADLGVPDGQFPSEFFTDGGVYDNLGVRAFSWLKEAGASFDQVLVSDAGKPFQILSDAALGLIGQSVRATDILWDRVWQLEHENFGHQEGFVFFPITHRVEGDQNAVLLPAVVQAEVQSVRTDLDRFSAEEINSLAQHGYEVARAICRDQGLPGVPVIAETQPWAPIPVASTAAGSVERKSAKAAAPAPTTRLSRRLRKSSRRRIWSTLLDWHDWPTYLYLAIAGVLLLYAPLQIYELYRKAEIQGQVIQSIANGDPDIHQILELATSDPTADWIGAEIVEQPEPSESTLEGVQFLTHSRIYDLRRWQPDAASPSQRGHVYIRDRIVLKFKPAYEGDGLVTIKFPIRIQNAEFRVPARAEQQATIRKVAQPQLVRGQERTLYELEFDLSQAPFGEPTTIEYELIGTLPKQVRAPFVTHAETGMISAWMLFPADRPYRTYSLVSYPADHSQPIEIMNQRYSIDHPYGSLIGWSVLNPQPDRIYECRWTTE